MADAPEEARAWIARGGELGSDGFAIRHNPSAFVESLYAAGAVLVAIEKNMIVATLSSDPDARARIIAIYNREVDAFGEEFGGEDGPGHEMTRAEAETIGHPEAEGEWVVDDLHISDSGQTRIRFWWD